jgi:uncharacterized protein (DUF952 family)
LRIHHLALADAWQSAQDAGAYTVSTLGLELADVGFIHCSRPEQVDDVYQRYYRAVEQPLRLLTIDTDLLSSPWQLDEVPGEPLTYPHIYGPLNLDAVVSVDPFRPSASS